MVIRATVTPSASASARVPSEEALEQLLALLQPQLFSTQVGGVDRGDFAGQHNYGVATRKYLLPEECPAAFFSGVQVRIGSMESQ